MVPLMKLNQRLMDFPGCRGWLCLGVIWAAMCCASDAKDASRVGQRDESGAAGFYQLTNIVSIHLSFTPEAWTAMEPKGAERGPFGGGRGGFGPGQFLAPAFLDQGDSDKNRSLSKAEFSALGKRWFQSADTDRKGTLTRDQVRTGLGSVLGGGPPPGGRGPGGGPPGGMNLQGAEGKRNGLSSAAGIEFNYVRASLAVDGVEFKDVAVRYKGNGTFMESRGSLKRSLKIDLNEFTKGQKLHGLTTLNLHNNITDPSWMNEPLSHLLFRDAGVPAPRSAYAQVYVTVPGKFQKEYFGLYSLIENPDKNFAQERYGDKKGAIFKPVSRTLFEDLGDDWSRYQQTFDAKQTLTEDQKQRVITFCKLVSHASDEEFASKLGEFVDLPEFAAFMVVNVWLANMDSILGVGQNFFAYLNPKSNKFEFWPWDLDHSFGQFPMVGSQDQREQLSIHHPWHGEVRFLERVFKVAAFKKLYLDKFSELNQSVFKPERIHQQIDQVAAFIRAAIAQESEEKKVIFNQAVAGEPVRPARAGEGERRSGERGRREGPGFGPGMFGEPPKPIRTFVTSRHKSVSEQLAGQSQGMTVERMGFGGRGPRGGGGPGGPGRPGGGPGEFLGRLFMESLDADRNDALTEVEWTSGFEKWFSKWDEDKDGVLSEEQLRAGINQDLSPFPPGPPPP